MESMPDAILQHIISLLSNARDVAACTCVSRRWKDSVPYIPSLYFPRNALDALPRPDADAVIARMISAAPHLEELVIYCPFSAAGLAQGLALCSRTLRVLELRLDGIDDKSAAATGGASARNPLDCIGVAKDLEELKLWGVSLAKSPNWVCLHRLRSLEIIGAAMMKEALQDVLRMCPNVTDLALLGCHGLDSVSIGLERLESCRLDFLGSGNCSLLLSSPRLEELDIQGFSWICVDHNHRIRKVCISDNTGRVYKVDMGKLAHLEYMSLRGIQWSWSAISSVLQSASEVKHLVMKIEFCGDFDTLQPFPEINFVEFFNGHPRLQKFEIHGALFAALCHKNSLKNVDSRFIIPFLEEVLITVRSPLNAEQKLNTLESLVKYSMKLRKMTIRISQMKNCHETADDFFEEICKFKYLNYKIVQIE